MPKPRPVSYEEPSPEVRAVFDDIKRVKNIPEVKANGYQVPVDAAFDA